MAYFHGNEVNHWWGYGNVSTSNQSGSVTRVTLTAGMQARGWGFDISYVDATATISGQSATTYDNDFYSPSGGYAAVDMVTKTLDITRTHSAQTINVSIKVVNRSSYMDGTSTASSTVTIPARASYSVSYNANGGTGAPSAQTKWHDETLTLSTTKPTRSGYSFQGWATSSGGSVAYAAGAAYKSNAAVTLYAVWAASSWTVAYNANGGTSTPASQTKNYNVALKLANAITRNNSSVSHTVTYDANGGSSTGASGNKQTTTTTTTYTFSVWKATDGKTYSGGANYTANAATTMTAQWTTSTSGGTVTLPTPTRAGHNFNGWYNGSSRVGGAGGTYRPTANVTLKARWTVQTWTVQYNANGGSGAPASQTKTYGQTLKLSSTQPRRSGYTFLGWATASDGTGTAYAAGGNYTANAAATLYAVWIAVQVTSVTGYRCESDGTKADGGTYGHLSAGWKALGTIAGTVAVTATANDADVTSTLSNRSGSKTATADLSNTSTGTFGGSYAQDVAVRVSVTATLTVSYGGSSRSVSATRVATIPKVFRLLDALHGGTGLAIGAIATLANTFEVALQTLFQNVVEVAQSNITRDGTYTEPVNGDHQIRFVDGSRRILSFLSAHKTGNSPNNYLRLSVYGPSGSKQGNVYISASDTDGYISTDCLINSNLMMSTVNKGYYLKGRDGASYPGIYNNGSNLWIGSTETASTHHVGETYISAGYDATNGKGYPTIYVSVPNATNDGGTNYGVYHAGNKPTPADIGIVTGTSTVSNGVWKWVKLPGGIAIAHYDDSSNRSIAITSTSGNIYYGSVGNIAFPFTFAAIPTVSVSMSGTGNAWTQASFVTTSGTGTMYFGRGNSSTLSNKLHITVIGIYS